MKEKKRVGRVLCWLLVLTLGFSMTGCAFPLLPVLPGAGQSETGTPVESGGTAPVDPETERIFEIKSVHTTSVTRRDGAEQTTVQLMEYNERGLVTAITVTENGRETRTSVSYRWNEQGDPCGYTVESEEEPISAELENQYENGRLAEAVISDLVMNGESLQASGVLDQGSPAAAASVSFAMQLLQSYVGYRDCSLRMAGADNEIRYENGHMTYINLAYPGVVQETVTEYRGDGGTYVTQNVYETSESGRLLRSSTGTLTDAQRIERELTVSAGEGEGIRISYRYEAGKDPETGREMLTAYYDKIICPDDPSADAERVKEQLAQMENQPVARYYLDEDGNVLQREQTEEYRQMTGGQRITLWYDNKGRTTKQETVIESSGYAMTMVTEYDYRQ